MTTHQRLVAEILKEMDRVGFDPDVAPDGSACDRNTAAERAITPPGFARAFFEANP